MTLARGLYSAATWLAQPALRAKLRRRGAEEPLYLEHVGERFGRYPSARPVRQREAPPTGLPERRERARPADGSGSYVWVHAVSLGETRAAAVLIDALRRRMPHARVLLTHGTATGRAEGTRLLRPGDEQVWLPWDTPGAVRRFLARFKPRVGVLVETEVWPNLVAACARAGVPLALVSARMSPQSLRRAERLGWLARPAYASLGAVFAQGPADARRLRSLGAPVQAVTGNLKFDARLGSADRALRAQGRAWREAATRPVIALAVSREGEEQMLIDAIAAQRGNVLADTGPVHWLVVPRHPQRFEAVARLFEQAGFRTARRSAWGADGPSPLAEVWIGDSVGEMPLYYGLATVALLGGSFGGTGGQNLIEAALCRCPLVMGPSTYNFTEAADWSAEAGAAVEAPDMPAAVLEARRIAFDAPRRQAMADAARAFVQAHRGAADKTVRGLVRLARDARRG